MPSNVCIEKSVVTKRSDDAKNPKVLFGSTVEIAKGALRGRPMPDEVYITSQTFIEHCMPDFCTRFATIMGMDPKTVHDEKVFSNMQPVLQRVFDRVRSTQKRVLMVGVEGLSFLDPKRRPKIIGEALNAEWRNRYGTMLNAIAHLTAEWMNHISLTREQMRSLLRAVALVGYKRSYENPNSQFYKVKTHRGEPGSVVTNANGQKPTCNGDKKPITEEVYDSHDHDFVDQENSLFIPYDCCPGNTTQAAAMVVGPEGPIKVVSWANAVDGRPPDERVGFADYPRNEAVHKAFESVLSQSGLSKEEMIERGILEIHDAFGSLIPMTLMEMGYLKPDDLKGEWETMGHLPKERINPMGGLKAGHPLGATALVRLHEAGLELLGQAPTSLQVQKPLDYALVQSVYGPRDQISMTLLGRQTVGQ